MNFLNVWTKSSPYEQNRNILELQIVKGVTLCCFPRIKAPFTVKELECKLVHELWDIVTQIFLVPVSLLKEPPPPLILIKECYELLIYVEYLSVMGARFVELCQNN